MKDILFRGKGIITRKWHYGRYVRRIFDDIGHYIVSNGLKGEIRKREVFPKSLGQYTGKHDAGENMVFGGDIVQDKGDSEILGVIVWNNEREEFVIDCKGDYIDMEHITDFYVIGNTTDNPEMVKELRGLNK